MELHNHQRTSDQVRRLVSEMDAAVERISSAREARVEQVTELTERHRARRAQLSDSVQLSAAGRLFTDQSEDDARAALVDSLKAAYESGNLNTQERIGRAAQALLAGE